MNVDIQGEMYISSMHWQHCPLVRHIRHSLVCRIFANCHVTWESVNRSLKESENDAVLSLGEPCRDVEIQFN